MRVYRPDIDGLRGLAVGFVLLFHFFPTLAPGGFVGVDVFFVLSGYLITGIITEEIAAGTFTFGSFYARRVRRLFPALVVVLLVTYAVGWFVLLPEQFEHLGAYIAAAAAFGSNFLSLHEAGYFDSNSHVKPLLHLWSLGIEEQFYALWPLLLFLAARFRLRFILFAAVIGCASFAVNIAYLRSDLGTVQHDLGAVAAFYSPLARFWELMVGAALSLITVRGPRDILSATGLACIALAVYAFVDPSRFPGWLALWPTVGTALLIAGEGSWINRRVLPALAGLGKISYPLYLWHWPVFSLTTIVAGEPSIEIRVVLALLSIALAYGTWRFIERPIRFGQFRGSARAIAALCIGIAVIGGAGLVTYKANGLPFRMHYEVVNRGEPGNEYFFAQLEKRFHHCEPPELYAHRLRINGYPARCVQTREGTPNVALVGDSIAEDLIVGLAEAFPQSNIVTYIRNAMPVPGPQPSAERDFSEIFDHLLHSPSISTVILGAHWGWRQVHELPAGADMAAELDKAIGPLVRSGKTVYVLDGRPTFAFEPERCRLAIGGKTECSMSAAAFRREHANFFPVLEQVAAKYPGVKILRMDDFYCGAETCSMAAKGILTYRDSMHLTLDGSRSAVQGLIARHGLALPPSP